MVSRPATPGIKFLYPPPKLAMRCGSMLPMETTRSDFATVLLIDTNVLFYLLRLQTAILRSLRHMALPQ